MSQTKEEIEQELQSFKDANLDWRSVEWKSNTVTGFNNRLASFTVNQKSLNDGIPPMEQVISESGASIPPESQHASCEHEIMDSFTLQNVNMEVKHYRSSLWDTLSKWNYMRKK